MNEHITVLLADDTLIARAGWRHILSTDSNIEVVGEAIVSEAVFAQTKQLRPRVVLLDLKWDNDNQAGLELIPRLKREMPETKVIAVSAYEELLAQARARGANGALPKSFSSDQLFAAIHTVCTDESTTETAWAVRLELDAKSYINRLADLKPGKRDAKHYELLMEEILKFLFSKHLSDFLVQCRHHDGDEIWDIVAFNKSGDPFWSTIRQQHNAGQILFELKNVRLLRSDSILQLADYLGDPLMHFGILVTRNPPHISAAKKARSVIDKRKDIILILTDDDIIEMLRVKMNGDDPTPSLSHIYLTTVRS